MPINPETGMHEESQGSRFPQGIFGGALGVNNARIGANLAQEAATRRALEDHMTGLKSEDMEESMVAKTKERQAADDLRVREEGFRNVVKNNPDADSGWLAKQAMAYGVSGKEAATLGTMAYHEGINANKTEKLNIDYLGEARKGAKDFLEQGWAPKDVADLQRQQYGDKIPSTYYDKLAMLPKNEMAGAEIQRRKASANKMNADAGKAARGTASDDGKLLKEQGVLLGQIASLKARLEEPGFIGDPAPIQATLSNKEVQLKRVNDKLALIGQNNKVTTAPVPKGTSTITTTPAPPKFAPQPAAGKPEGAVANVTMPDGTIVPAVVRNGMLVPAN